MADFVLDANHEPLPYIGADVINVLQDAGYTVEAIASDRYKVEKGDFVTSFKMKDVKTFMADLDNQIELAEGNIAVNNNDAVALKNIKHLIVKDNIMEMPGTVTAAMKRRRNPFHR